MARSRSSACWGLRSPPPRRPLYTRRKDWWTLKDEEMTSSSDVPRPQNARACRRCPRPGVARASSPGCLDPNPSSAAVSTDGRAGGEGHVDVTCSVD
ncbi:hypothetical protein NL676_028049 [Syzygium grande]|nr:hypothetical protein NL676_028049 [Syzygium grande]